MTLAGDALAWIDICARNHVYVREPPSATAPATYAIPTGYIDDIRGSGRYLAWLDNVSLVVYDHVARSVSYRVRDYGYGWAVQDDGKSAFINYYPDTLAWASASEPRAHFVTKPCSNDPACTGVPPGSTVIGMADDLIGLAEPDGDYPYYPYAGERIKVFRLDGSVVASTRITSPGYGLAQATFDGRHIAFATQPCQTTVITVWDIRDRRPPRVPRGDCPPARPEQATARGKRLRIRLACPAKPRLGCAGFVHAVAYEGARFVSVNRREFGVPYGRSRALSLRMSAHARRFFARHSQVKLYVEIEPLARSDLPLAGPSRRSDFFLPVHRIAPRRRR